MKKMLVMASLATILGLSFYSATHSDFSAVGEKDEDKTYIVTVGGDVLKDDAKTLKKYRNQVLSQIAYELPEGSYEVTSTYDVVLNGFAIKVNSAYADKIESIKGVSALQENHTYALPDTDSYSSLATGDKGEATKAERLANYSAETMRATAADVKSVVGEDSFGGKNITIGIIDTGMYINQIEGSEKRLADEKKYALNAAAFRDLSEGEYKMSVSDLTKLGFSTNYYSHYNNKVFFARDYAGGDADVDPTTNGSEHGTHVASISGANGADFQGIAPNSQIAVLKVFGDDQAGAGTDAIISALEDAAKLGLDLVNLSLGSDLSTSTDEKDNATFTAVKSCMAKGTIVNFAAGNSGKSSFSSSRAYSEWGRDIVETGILGGDAHFDEAANIVAASTPEKAFFESIMTVQKNGATSVQAVSYSDQSKSSATQPNITDRPLASLIPAGKDKVTEEYVVVPNYGKSADYEGIDVTGKIAVVNRGTTTFIQKVKQATSHGAVAMICINNDPSVTFNFSMAFEDFDPAIPVVFVFKNTASIFGPAGSTGTLTIGTNTVQAASDGNTIASFSSDGGDYNLDMGITISAPGKEIIGAVDATAYNDNSDATNPGISLLHGYENLSGTSMACPNLTGAMALYLSERLPENNGKMKVADFDLEKDKVSLKAMGSADQLIDTTGDGTPNSVRMQGAGRINVKKMLATDSYVTTTNKNLDGFDNEVQSKAELKNAGSLKVEGGKFTDASENFIEFDYTIHNDSDKERTYTPTLSLMIPHLGIMTTHDEYKEQEESSRKETIGYDSSVTFDESNPDTYPYGVGQITTSVNDDIIDIPADHQLTGTVSVAAHSTTNAKVKVRIDDLHLTKDFGDSMVENFEGTLKEYFAKYFAVGGGNYVEGYLKLEEASGNSDLTLSMPYLGFYGDYTVGDAVEDFDIEKEENRLYTSELVDNYMQNLNDQYKKNSAYTGSTISSTGSALSAKAMANIGAMNGSAKADGANYLTVTDGKDSKHLYAGATGISDHLIASFFVNRAVSVAKWTIKNGDKAVSTGAVEDLGYYSGQWATNATGGELFKSWLVNGDNAVPYFVHRGIADINLSKLDEGDYTLEFSFEVKGAAVTQTKSYILTVDKTAPELNSLSIRGKSGKQYLDVVGKGADYRATANITATVDTTKVDGSDDLYSASFRITDRWLKDDRVYVELTDLAHNKLMVIVKPSDITFSVASTFFTNKHTFDIAPISSKNGVTTYSVAFTNTSGKDYNPTGSYYVYMNVGKKLSNVSVKVSGSDANFSYNPETGLVSVLMGKNDASFSISYDGSGSNTPSTDNTEKPGTSENPGTSEEKPSKKGCGGSVIAASTTLGALALVATAVALKKKKEQK